MSGAISAIKDANPKDGLLGLDCLQFFVENNIESFQSLINVSLEILITKLGDTKVSLLLKHSTTVQYVLSYSAFEIQFNTLGSDS